MYKSRLKSGKQNIAIIESIFILNNICIESNDNDTIRQKTSTKTTYLRH